MAQKYDLKKLYIDWFAKFVANGGSASETLTTAFPQQNSNWRVAVDQETITASFGTNAKNILVPADITISVANTGHNNIYYVVDGKMKSKKGYAPKFSDT